MSMISLSRPNRLRHLFKSRKAILVAVLVLVTIAGWLAIKSIQGPSVGDVYKPSQGATIEKPAYIEIDGKEVAFAYPENYKPDTENLAEPNIIEDYLFKKASTGNRPGNLTLTVSVYKLQSAKLEEDGAYRLRKSQPDIYIQRLSSVNNYAFTIFKKKDGSETTAFVQDKNRVATISMSGSLANNNQSEAEFTAILNSWRWK